ncbi:hypothetical protein CC79DRAFT_1088652 [Sarocladium strictum]
MILHLALSENAQLPISEALVRNKKSPQRRRAMISRLALARQALTTPSVLAQARPCLPAIELGSLRLLRCPNFKLELASRLGHVQALAGEQLRLILVEENNDRAPRKRIAAFSPYLRNVEFWHPGQPNQTPMMISAYYRREVRCEPQVVYIICQILVKRVAVRLKVVHCAHPFVRCCLSSPLPDDQHHLLHFLVVARWTIEVYSPRMKQTCDTCWRCWNMIGPGTGRDAEIPVVGASKRSMLWTRSRVTTSQQTYSSTL